jgi:hypothetical protein
MKLSGLAKKDKDKNVLRRTLLLQRLTHAALAHDEKTVRRLNAALQKLERA